MRFAVQYPLASGEFGIMLVQGGQSTLLGTMAVNAGQSSYTYPWTVAGAPGTGYVIRGRLAAHGRQRRLDGDWRTAAPFTILKAQAITVTAPGAAAVWPRKSTQTVRWTLEQALGSGSSSPSRCR